MKELRRQLKELLQQAGADAEVLEAFRQENAVFPFSAESRILMYLMNAQAITYEQYQEINICICLRWHQEHSEKPGVSSIF